MEELYELNVDPHELQNLALDAQYHETVRKLRTETILELRRTDAKMADQLPSVRPL